MINNKIYTIALFEKLDYLGWDYGSILFSGYYMNIDDAITEVEDSINGICKSVNPDIFKYAVIECYVPGINNHVKDTEFRKIFYKFEDGRYVKIDADCKINFAMF